jgi:hypothetical protein
MRRHDIAIRGRWSEADAAVTGRRHCQFLRWGFTQGDVHITQSVP